MADKRKVDVFSTGCPALVLDTNAAISALLWHGTPGKLIDAAAEKNRFLFMSASLLAELRGVLDIGAHHLHE